MKGAEANLFIISWVDLGFRSKGDNVESLKLSTRPKSIQRAVEEVINLVQIRGQQESKQHQKAGEERFLGREKKGGAESAAVPLRADREDALKAGDSVALLGHCFPLFQCLSVSTFFCPLICVF